MSVLGVTDISEDANGYSEAIHKLFRLRSDKTYQNITDAEVYAICRSLNKIASYKNKYYYFRNITNGKVATALMSIKSKIKIENVEIEISHCRDLKSIVIDNLSTAQKQEVGMTILILAS